MKKFSKFETKNEKKSQENTQITIVHLQNLTEVYSWSKSDDGRTTNVTKP